MKIVKLSELNDEERRKLIEEEENRINQRNKERINIQQQANADFNNQIAKSGSYQSKGSTSLGTLRKLYKDNSVTEKSLNNYYNTHKNNNQKTMWDRIKDTAGNSLKQTAIGMTGNPMWSLLGNINNNVNKFVTDEQKNKVGYIGKRTGAGVIQGVTGIGQAGLTDLANQANKGKDKNITNTIGDVVKSFTNISNPASRINPIQTGINTLKTLTDKDKNILQKGISLATGGISDTLNQTIPGKDIINSTTQALGKINPNTSNALLKYTNAISKPSEDINEKLNEEGQKYDTITNMLAGAGQTIGNMAPSIALSTVNPTAGLGLMGLSAKGQSTQEALKKGASLDEAVKIGDTKGMIEIGTEMLSGGINIFGKGALDDLVQKGVVDKVKNKVAKKLVQMGVNNAGEVGEELVSDVLGTLIDKGTVDPNAKYTLNDFKDTAINTILTTTVLNFLTGGLARNVGSINNTKSMNIEQQNQVENQNNINTQQITQTPNNLSQNQTSEQIGATKTLQTDNINQNISSNKNLYNETANKYNIDTNNNTVKSIQEVTEKRGIQARYDADIFNNSNEEAIWTQKEDRSREIIINPLADSNKTLQNIVVHELFHDFEGTQEKKILTNMALEKMKTQEGYEKAMKSLADTYAQKYDRNSADFNQLVEEEATAKFLGENLGNQEFVNELIAKQDRNAVQRVYDWVVDKVESLKNKITGDVEAEYWRKVKNNFEKAFSKQYEGNNNIISIKNSIQTDSNGNKYVKVDTNQDIFNGKSIDEQIKIARKYILDNFRENGINFNENNIKVTSKTANEYTHPKNKLPQSTRESKMKASTELDNLLNVSEYQYSSKDDGRHKFAKDGWDYYKTTFEVNGIKFEGLINIAKDGNKKTFYDVTKIKRISQNRSTSANAFSTSLTNSNNSILPTKDFVNRNTTKYSMQESENNSDSFSFDNKRFDVTGNENLDKSGTLFFRTRPDGIYYVQATDHSGSLIYEGTFLNKKSLSKTLGEDIAEYIVNNSEETNNEIYIDNQGNQPKDYKMYHRPSEEYGNASDFEHNMDGVFEHPQWYMDMNQAYNIESLEALRNVRNNPNAEITIYRATPGDNINYGDWVTPSKKYAELHNNSQLNGKGNILKLKVKAKDILWGGDDINEFGYFPDNNKYSQNNTFDNFVKQNSINKGTGETLEQVKLPPKKDKLPRKAENNQELEKSSSINLPTKQEELISKKQTLNPTEISNITIEDADTTPNLPTKNYKKGNKQSSFFRNVVTDSKYLDENLRQELGNEENIRYYSGITNRDTLEKAYTSLNEDGKSATLNWFNKESKNSTAEDVAKGWILLKQYQDTGDYQGAVEVAKKMRDIASNAGQTVQAYNILSRLSPEGMFYYAQSELTEAYNKMVQGKSQKWIEENRDKFELTPTETQFIMDTMQDVSTMEDGYNKKVKIAEIQKLITDKIPPTAGQSVKAWMRISMLFNPKTQVRNILGNAVILPVNATSDFVSSGIDKMISKKTGVRTTGNINLKNYGKGFGKGLYESYNDFRKGINTRNIEGNRFEVSEGKNFKDKGLGKMLNKTDNILSFMLDAGDRGFYEATFTNSINNQMTLNKTTEVTPEMIEIATNEALQRTWQDNNAYTQAVLKIRKILNSANIKGYGLGDVIIPFAKTPANLTKAIVDYSPVGLAKAITLDAKKFRNSLENGQFTPTMQHQLVQNIGKGMAGSFLYVLGYALAKAGIASGEADEDKDVKNFMKNSLGISSYSLKIGDKTFTYDWAQPIATPLAIMTNYVKYTEDNPDANAIEKAINSLNIGTEQLLQQSFMESLNTVLNGNGTTLENLSQAVLDLPARAVPTFSKQIADMVDGTQRTTFEYNQPVQSAINSVVAKIPGASKMLPSSVDTLGNEIQKYGGDNNIFNVFFNPTNVNKGQLSKAGEEIYRLYQETGDTTVFPITAPYYINNKGEKVNMTSEERNNYQKITGKYAEKAVNELLTNDYYKKLTDNKKAELLQEIITDSNAKAKHDVLNIETEVNKKKRELIEKIDTKSYYDYKMKTKDIEGKNVERRKNEVLLNSNYSNKIKSTLYANTTGKDDELYNLVLNKNNININEYLEYKIKDSKEEFSADKDKYGNSISGTSKKKYYNYINSNITGYNNKLLLLAQKYKLSNNERQDLTEYINKNYKGQDRIDVFKKLSTNYKVTADNKVYYK